MVIDSFISLIVDSEESAVKTQLDLKTLKFPRNVSRNCYFSLPVSGAEKKTSNTKVHPSRESSVFGSAASHSTNLQEVKTKFQVQTAPATETNLPDGEPNLRPKDSPSKYQSYKAREERCSPILCL